MKLKEIIQYSETYIDNAKLKSRLVAILRFVFFILFLFGIYYSISKSNSLVLILGLICLITFFFLVVLSNKFSEITIFNQNRIKICLDIINDKPTNPNLLIEFDPNHPYAYDLDIFGKKSLFDKINRCQTDFGVSKLQYFLLNPLLKSIDIIERQESIQELSLKLDWNIKFLATAKSKEPSILNVENLIKWDDIVNKFQTKFLETALKIIPISNIIFVGLFLYFNVSILSSLFIIIPILLSFIIHKIYNKSINEIYNSVNLKATELKKYATLFVIIERKTFTSKYNNSLKQKLISTDKVIASECIKKLSQLIDSFENKNIAIVGFFLNVIFLWDLQFAFRIEKHSQLYKNEIPKWFDTISEFEALISFSIFANQNEEYIYPIISDNSNSFKILNVSHPLVNKDKKIGNNFEIIKENNIIIITGANMTGKSTFLRTVGVNLVLAMNGCPVSSEYFSFHPISLFTSMRTSDSLSNDSSYFNAEIRRLKLLIEKLENNEPQFIILDEILKGTNSIDKLKGSEMFLEKIIKMKTTMNCIIATHDIELTKMENIYPNNINNFCFELQTIDNILRPDYKLRIGVTKSMNAISLMKELKIID